MTGSRCPKVMAHGRREEHAVEFSRVDDGVSRRI
jgi:hypothetical protein